MSAVTARARVATNPTLGQVNAAVWRHCWYALGCFPALPVHLFGWGTDRVVHARSDSRPGPFTVLLQPTPAMPGVDPRVCVWAVDGGQRLTDPIWVTATTDQRALTKPDTGRLIVAAITAASNQAVQVLADLRAGQRQGEFALIPTTEKDTP